jgi:hypothetical protein
MSLSAMLNAPFARLFSANDFRYIQVYPMPFHTNFPQYETVFSGDILLGGISQDVYSSTVLGIMDMTMDSL